MVSVLFIYLFSYFLLCNTFFPSEFFTALDKCNTRMIQVTVSLQEEEDEEDEDKKINFTQFG